MVAPQGSDHAYPCVGTPIPAVKDALYSGARAASTRNTCGYRTYSPGLDQAT